VVELFTPPYLNSQAVAFSLAIAWMKLVALLFPSLSSKSNMRHSHLAKAFGLPSNTLHQASFVTTVWVGHAASGRTEQAKFTPSAISQ